MQMKQTSEDNRKLHIFLNYIFKEKQGTTINSKLLITCVTISSKFVVFIRYLKVGELYMRLCHNTVVILPHTCPEIQGISSHTTILPC